MKIHFTIFVYASVCSARRYSPEMEFKVLEHTFKANTIVPYYIPRSPYSIAKVNFRGSDIKLATTIPVELTTEPPTVSWDTCNEHHYTLIMIGPPFPGTLGNLCHWIVVNIPGTEVDRGEVLVAYLPPSPPPDTSPNLYVILVYEQPSYLHFEESNIIDTTVLSLPMRASFTTAEFADKYCLGNPVAGNFFDCTTTLDSIIV